MLTRKSHNHVATTRRSCIVGEDRQPGQPAQIVYHLRFGNNAAAFSHQKRVGDLNVPELWNQRFGVFYGY